MGQAEQSVGRVAFLSGPEFLEHRAGLGHPERPERLAAIWSALADAGLWDDLLHLQPRPATVEQLCAVHTPEYVELARREISSGRSMLSTGDTNVCPASYDVAVLAAGGGLVAVEAVCSGQARAAFCAVRPPGHHATPSAGMGFCVFNNAAVAARYAQAACGIDRVLIVDWDVHHGNGTQDAFFDDPSVLYFSVHQLGHYPMGLTGRGWPNDAGGSAAEGTTLNVPLPGGSGDADYLAAFDEKLAPAARRFAPDLVIVSAGFDCRRGDPLAGMEVTDAGFAAMTERVMAIADATAAGRIVSFLEGGYDLAGLAAGATAHVRALLGRGERP